ncbi:MAG: helix-turn-helix transcriptional regulator [Polyangiaceae bacterium]|nr:helix-turn-helix transcriptional regulator [Polyangiaceae bacterium]
MMPPLLTTISVEVRRRRRALGLSVEALAQRAELDRSTVSRIERAKQGTSLGTIIKLAHALGTRAGELLVPRARAEALVTAQLFERSPPALRHTLLALARNLANRNRAPPH